MMSATEPLISIIIPCHNYAHTLGATLDSIQAQTVSAWEAIIVNDGSSDNTGSVIESFALKDKRIVGISQERRGVSAARNKGMRAARGKYLLFLDADDLITPEKIEAHKKHFDSDPSIDVSYSYCQYFHTSSPDALYASFDLTQKEWIQKFKKTGEPLIRELFERNLFVISSPVIKRSAASSTIEFKVGMRYYEDWLYWFSCAAAGLSFHYCDDERCSTLIRVHDTSTVQSTEKMFDSIPLFRKELSKVLNSTTLLSNVEINKLQKQNFRHLKKWCRKKLNTSGVKIRTIKELIEATDTPTAYLALSKHLAKKPTYLLKDFFTPK